MTEQEAKEALFKIHFWYMSHPPKERIKIENEYQEKRNAVKKELARLFLEKKEMENKEKTVK